jgi:hypothetical protein
MRDIVWVDGSPGTVAALLRHDVKSPRTIASCCVCPAQCLGARGDTGALSWLVVRFVPRDMWRHWSPLLAGGVLYASGHVVEPELSATGSRSRAAGLIF